MYFVPGLSSPSPSDPWISYIYFPPETCACSHVFAFILPCTAARSSLPEVAQTLKQPNDIESTRLASGIVSFVCHGCIMYAQAGRF